jgi:hypothetical protein
METRALVSGSLGFKPAAKVLYRLENSRLLNTCIRLFEYRLENASYLSGHCDFQPVELLLQAEYHFCVYKLRDRHSAIYDLCGACDEFTVITGEKKYQSGNFNRFGIASEGD